jgi:hypothetical protein
MVTSTPHQIQPTVRERLTAARDGLYEIRRQIDALRPALANGPSDTINSARQELCGALARRIEIAEGEIQELLDMLELDTKK